MTPDELSLIVRSVGPVIREYVTAAVADLTRRLTTIESRPVPQDGRDGEKGADGVPGKDGRDGADGLHGKDGAAGPPGPPGTDGARGEPGPPGATGPAGPEGVAGRDGLPGRDGQSGLVGEKGADGTNGRDGSDGKDGLGFDDLRAEYDGERGLTLVFQRGAETKSFPMRLPIPIYRGVFKAGTLYERGDLVTWQGSMFSAVADTAAKPGESAPESRAWVLSTQRGRDGKAGPEGKPGPKGPQGEMGPQGRSGY